MSGIIIMYSTCTRCDFRVLRCSEGLPCALQISQQCEMCQKFSRFSKRKAGVSCTIVIGCTLLGFWQAGQWVTVYPSDSGTGIDAHKLGHCSCQGSSLVWLPACTWVRESDHYNSLFFFFTRTGLCHNLFACREYMWKWSMTVTIGEYSSHSPIPPSRTPSMWQFKKGKTNM